MAEERRRRRRSAYTYDEEGNPVHASEPAEVAQEPVSELVSEPAPESAPEPMLEERTGPASDLSPEASARPETPQVDASEKANFGQRFRSLLSKFDKKFVVGLLVLALVFAAVLYLPGKILALKAVYVKGNSKYSTQQIVAYTKLYRGMNMLTIEQADVAAALSANPELELVEMKKSYPSTLYLTVRERKGAAVLNHLGNYFLLDNEGMILREMTESELPEGLPILKGLFPTSLNVGQVIMVGSTSILEAYQSIITELENEDYTGQIETVNLSDIENLTMTTTSGYYVVLGNSRYMSAKIKAMKIYIPYLQQQNKTGGTLYVTTPHRGSYLP